MDDSDLICFEMPTHDLMRYSVKFEDLYRLAQHYSEKADANDHRMAMTAITDLIVLLDRPELRSKYFQEFTRFKHYLSRLLDTSEIDQARLKQILEQLQTQLKNLEKDSGKFASPLRDNKFLSKIIQYRGQAGDDCGYNTPAYFLWLHQAPEQRTAQMKAWLAEFKDIAEIIAIFLKLIRHTGHFQNQVAHKGFYQQAIDPKLSCHLIQIRLDKSLNIYPKISIGRHGLSVRFVKSSDEASECTSESDIKFELACCTL